MSMRALWFMLFVLAPLATLAGYGSTYGIGSAGGGVTVGNAVSGGTTSRLLFNDANGLVSTASPALGAGLTLTGALQGTSSNWTGQAVFSGVTTDISTGTNEDLTAAPNGTGNFVVVTESSTYTQDNAITTLVHSSSNQIFALQGGATSAYADFRLRNSSGTSVAQNAYFGSTYSDAELQNKAGIMLSGITGGAWRSTDANSSTDVWEVRDNVSATGVQLFAVTGTGTKSLLYGSMSNCSDGAGAAACSAAPAGSVVIDAAATTVVVSTTAVTANSQIFIQEDSSLGTKLSATCNTTTGRTYTVSARTDATSFTITASAAPVTNPACLSYFIVN